MENKEQEYKFYKEYIRSIYGNAYMSAMAKICVPRDLQLDATGNIRKDLFLTEQEREAIKAVFPYLSHMDKVNTERHK